MKKGKGGRNIKAFHMTVICIFSILDIPFRCLFNEFFCFFYIGKLITSFTS